MREAKWRSLSIMDLHLAKRGSLSGLTGGAASTATASGTASKQQQHEVPMGHAGQSYELIKSTQSLVDKLQLNTEDITIQPVHPSIIGQDTWFQITYTSSGTTRYFSCQNSKERDEWILSLKKTLMLNEDRRRTDNSLKLDVLEVKGLSDKKKYYVEVLVDDKLYARTSSKKMTDMCCFWGEQFSFADLPHNTEKLSLLIHKDKGTTRGRKKPKKPVGRVKISVPSVQSRYIQDKWYTVEKSSRRESPSIRLRCQYQSVDILPLRDYEEFLYFLKDEYKALCKLLEPNISVKVKEELSNSLMNVFHSEEMAEDVLAEIVVDEISNIEHEHLTFRGNSIATKAMECYIKLVGQRYLQDTLNSVLGELLIGDLDLEIDPIKLGSNPELLNLHRQSLIQVVSQVWKRIAKSHSYFPIQLQRCFYKIRQYLQHVGKPDIGDNLISSCIFLRYLCPAILAPSLFNLTDEYPSERANRNLTLVAKTLQTLANFTRYEGKENSMEFLNAFITEESGTMKTFLLQISSPLAEDGWIPNLCNPVEKSDLGRHLSCLHTILFENISKLPVDNPKSIRLRQLLDDINSIMNRPTIPQLEQISQPTMKTLKKMQSSNSSSSNGEKTFAGITLPWIGTLPKKNKTNNNNGNSNNLSHPAPHHEAPKATHFFVKASAKSPVGIAPTEGVSLSSETTSSSSASLTPSPGGHMKDRRNWVVNEGTSSSSASSVVTGTRHQTNTSTLDPYMMQRRRSSKQFTSSMSLDETDSSDDSTYSSQCPSDTTSTPRCTSHTLPRPHTSGAKSATAIKVHNNQTKCLSDYEHEILELRSAMEQLQFKLSEAERRLHTQGKDLTVSVTHQREEEAKKIVARLMQEEDHLRREHLDLQSSCDDAIGEKERMILMQQKKIAALDAANVRLLEELNRMTQRSPQPIAAGGGGSSTASGGSFVSVTTNPGGPNITSINTSSNSVSTSSSVHDRRFSSPSSTISSSSSSTAMPSNRSITVITNGEPASSGSSSVQETPKTVDELLDSLHSTPI